MVEKYTELARWLYQRYSGGNMNQKKRPKRTKKTQGEDYLNRVMSGVPKVKALRGAGVPFAMPATFEKSKDFKAAKASLVEQLDNAGITSKVILDRLYGLLTKKEKALSFGQVIVVDEVDTKSVKAALDLIVKLKADQEANNTTVNPLAEMSIAELIAATTEAEENREFGGAENLAYLEN